VEQYSAAVYSKMVPPVILKNRNGLCTGLKGMGASKEAPVFWAKQKQDSTRLLPYNPANIIDPH